MKSRSAYIGWVISNLDKKFSLYTALRTDEDEDLLFWIRTYL